MSEPYDRTVAFPDGESPALPFERPRGTTGPVGPATCVALHPHGAAPVTLGTVLFRYGGTLRLAVIAKAAFSMNASPMEPLTAPPIYTRDSHHEGMSTARVLVANDLVPGRTRVDVTLDGYAQTAFGASLPAMTVRLLLEQHGAAAIDKRLRIVGANGAPFSRMPVGYEHATQGEGAYATPIGVSARAQANVRDPIDGSRAAGFGPFAEAWPVRRSLLTSAQLDRICGPVMDLAADLDWRFFQAAPPDQQLDELAPDAKLTIAGFDSNRPGVSAQLPNASAKGVVFGLDAGNPLLPTELRFRADSVHIHANKAECVVCWRAVVDVPSEAAAQTLRVVAGVQTAAGAIELPTRPPGSAHEPHGRASATPPAVSGTANITDEMLAEAKRPLPFIEASTLEGLATAPPWIDVSVERGRGTGTAIPRSATGEPLPFKPRRDLAAGLQVLSQLPAVPSVEPPMVAPPMPHAPVLAPPTPEPMKPEPMKPEPPKPEPPKPEPPAERVIRVSNTTEPTRAAKKPKPTKKKRVRRVSEGVDLNALLYGKKS